MKLDTYEILAPLGAGGMGVVYRALDTKLKREVAIKILPDKFAGDPERVSRFQREAEALAALNHTNIASIYDFQEASGHRFLVLELVEGETLADRIGRGPLAFDEALQIAKQIAEALEAAHGKSIVHRDLKPANIKLTPDGKVKVLDFGLAKVFQPEPTDMDFSKSPTLMSGTMAGVILGTAAYMSPEQARGQSTDHRTDIWAFGCVLYEMLTGKQAFDGQTLTDVLGGIVRVDPDWQLLPNATPPMIRYLLRRCFDKNRARRLQSITEARVAIEDVSNDASLTSIVSAPPQKARSSRIERLAWSAVVLALAIAAAVFYARTLEEQPETRLQVVTPLTTEPLLVAVSPDGRRLVFSGSMEGRNQLWLRSLDSVTAQPLSGTEDGRYPFWSPDSRWIGFFADGKLKRIDTAGGTAQTIADAATGRGGTWNREDIILFAPTNVGGLYRVSAGGGQITEVTKVAPPQQVSHRFPQFLPDGKRFVFFAQGDAEGRGVYAGSLDGEDSRRLFDASTSAAYLSSGHLLFVRQSTLFAQSFDAGELELEGNPFVVTDQVANDPGFNLGAFSGASDVLAYRPGIGSGNREIVWVDRSGKASSAVLPVDASVPANPEISPDGKRIALDRFIASNRDVWTVEPARDIVTRFSVDSLIDLGPIWSPDGERIIFSSNRKSGSYNLYQKSSRASGSVEELLLESPHSTFPSQFSPNGQFLLYVTLDPKTGNDLWVMSVRDRKLSPYVVTPFTERDGQFSPDSRWVAYSSNESGRFEVYAQPFPGLGARFQISNSGGSQPRWRADGKELFYIDQDSKLMSVPIRLGTDGTSLEPGRPAALFATRIAGGPIASLNKQQYAVSPDGQRFLINVSTEQASASPITVILNWHAP